MYTVLHTSVFLSRRAAVSSGAVIQILSIPHANTLSKWKNNVFRPDSIRRDDFGEQPPYSHQVHKHVDFVASPLVHMAADECVNKTRGAFDLLWSHSIARAFDIDGQPADASTMRNGAEGLYGVKNGAQKTLCTFWWWHAGRHAAIADGIDNAMLMTDEATIIRRRPRWDERLLCSSHSQRHGSRRLSANII